jgi:hypothetical protein
MRRVPGDIPAAAIRRRWVRSQAEPLEFHGTRKQCFDWLSSLGFRRDEIGWHKGNWTYSLSQNAGEFSIKAWEISVVLPRKKRAQDLDIPADITHIYSEEERSDQ